jgi:putative intracellular protease/amidase
MASILAVVTSTHALPGGAPTGFWLEELSTPYWLFTDAGHDVSVASPAGGEVKPDAASTKEPFLTESGTRLTCDDAATAKLNATLALSAVNPDHYDAIFLVGGVGAAYDFDRNPHLDRLIDRMAQDGKIVSAVCHGVIGLTSAVGLSGVPYAQDQRMTGFSRNEEIAMGLLDIVPVVPEERLKATGADYIAGAEPFDACVAEGPLFVTGQNPASAGGVAEIVLARLAC